MGFYHSIFRDVFLPFVCDLYAFFGTLYVSRMRLYALGMRLKLNLKKLGCVFSGCSSF
ncbi:hypothetical protein DF16_pBMB8513orf00017 (plasmid) [Bacillus thuringiensis serovar kurstaki str. YBT-1520]|nr:hypothetical protein HD73_8509 [Bacillus thuringiensis serovar kurstaki str. HD73]AIM34324.1 hypothetical protein DF16_pBMB8513orf00017 [Bacillus thuringiensis serovar kurstaki str. YBT-1520]